MGALSQAMGAWDHGGGFSVDASVRIEADDRLGLERLLRYCARPAFALERSRKICGVPSSKASSGQERGSVRVILTPLELIERLASLIRLPHQKAAQPPEAAIGFSGPRTALAGRCRAQIMVNHGLPCGQ
jgi:hypothetical protein